MSLLQVRPAKSVPLILALALATLTGCATVGQQTPEQQVEARANAYWKARVGADPKAAYAFLTPAYKGLRSEQDFARQFGTGISAKKAVVNKVTCETAEKCLANVALTAKPSLPGLSLPEVTSYFDDTWLFEDGQWWRHEAP